MVSKATEQATSLLFLFLGVGMVVLSGHLQPVIENDVGSGFLPKIVGIGLIVLSLLKLVLSFMSNQKQEQNQNTAYNMKKGILTIFIFAVYVITIKYLGFFTGTLLYLAAQVSVFKWDKGLNKKDLIEIALLSILAPFIIKLIFVNMLDLVLPTSRLF